VTESLPEIARHVVGLAKLVKEGLTMKLRRTALTWVGFMLLLASSAQAQVGTEGGILGVVLDASGAVVAGAEVTVTNLDTNLKKQAVSDSAGNFEILALPRGPYSVTATFAGFKTWTLERTELTIGERKRIAPVLQVGEVSDKVTVEARAELLQTEKGWSCLSMDATPSS
jgi:Carboxypeptidase regulatory-like domain